jgi:nucleoside-diphosphate-sugar epimerase
MSEVFVIGGSGAVGGFLLARLQAAGRDAVALSRAPRAARPGVRWLQGGLDAGLAAPPVDSILCAGPLDHFVAWLETATPAGLQRIVALSSMSADSKQASPSAAERELAARLRDAEQRLAAWCESRGVAWRVLRPTLIYGAGLDRSLTPLAAWGRRLRLFPYIPGALGLRQPVHADDVAAACVATLAYAGPGQVFALGGGERLSYAQMLERVRASLACRTVPVPLPINLLRAMARLGGRGAGMVQRLNVDLVADNSAVEALPGVNPRGFRPDAGCWLPRAQD